MNVLICGSRNWQSSKTILKALRSLLGWHNVLYGVNPVIVHGAARGADNIGGAIAKELGCDVLEFPADWDRYGKAAGHKRNQQMLDECHIDLVLAFSTDIGSSKGTLDMVKRANKAGLEVRLYGKET